MSDDSGSPYLLLPLPGGRVARVPLAELEKFVEPKLALSHSAEDAAPPATADDDVTGHHLTMDATTGAATWHTDYELGPCSFTDAAGFPHYAIQWHRHPTGSEYAEVLG
jgi:hypothetical protein